MGIGHIIRGLNRDLNKTKAYKVKTNYENKGRLIPQAIYQEMKNNIYRCKMCNKRKGPRLEIDHIIPLSQGGTSDRTNLQAICKKCHQEKHKCNQ